MHCKVTDRQSLTQRGFKHNPHPAALVTQVLRSKLAKDAVSGALAVALSVLAEVPQNCYRKMLRLAK